MTKPPTTSSKKNGYKALDWNINHPQTNEISSTVVTASVAEANRSNLGDLDANQSKHYRSSEVKESRQQRIGPHLLTSSSRRCRRRRRRRRDTAHGTECVADIGGPGTTGRRVGPMPQLQANNKRRPKKAHSQFTTVSLVTKQGPYGLFGCFVPNHPDMQKLKLYHLFPTDWGIDLLLLP